MKNFLLTVIFFSFGTAKIHAQDDLMKMLDDETKKDKKRAYVAATFKTSRLINGHSI